jgi:hypothetical protein
MTKSSIYLHRDDILTIQQFLDAFPEAHQVEITCDSSSGIGAIIDATIHACTVNGQRVSVTKSIVDETSW